MITEEFILLKQNLRHLIILDSLSTYNELGLIRIWN